MTERITKQQLKEDALVKTTAEVADFASHHARLLIGGALALVILVVAVVFIRSGAARADERAAGMLSEAWADYNRGALDPARARLDDLLRTSAGTKPGKQAALLYGDILYQQGDFAGAEEYYRRALDSFGNDAILGMSARRGLAAALENGGKYTEAADIYAELAAGAADDQLRADLEIDQARNLLKAGQRDEAVIIYERVAERSDTPIASQTARLRLAEIELF